MDGDGTTVKIVWLILSALVGSLIGYFLTSLKDWLHRREQNRNARAMIYLEVSDNLRRLEDYWYVQCRPRDCAHLADPEHRLRVEADECVPMFARDPGFGLSSKMLDAHIGLFSTALDREEQELAYQVYIRYPIFIDALRGGAREASSQEARVGVWKAVVLGMENRCLADLRDLEGRLAPKKRIDRATNATPGGGTPGKGECRSASSPLVPPMESQSAAPPKSSASAR